MHKSNSATHLKIILSDVVKKSMDHIKVAAQVAQSLNKEKVIERLSELNSFEVSDTNKELKFTVESLGFAIDFLDEKERKEKRKLEDDLRFLALLEGLLDVLNDSVHPAYDVMPSLFHDEDEIYKQVEQLRKNREIAIERKVIDATCNCYSCRLKAKIGQ